MFYSSLCANAQDYLGRWRVQAGQIGNENQHFLVQHEPTRAIFDRQRENGDGTLHLTRQQVQELIVATSAVMRGISGLSIIASSSGGCLMPDSQGPGIIWMLGQPQAGAEKQPLTNCKAEWSISLSEQGQDGKWDQGRMVWDFLKREWQELAYGKTAAEMIETLAGDGRLRVVDVAEGYLIVTPEVLAPAFELGGQSQIATLEQQFGKGVWSLDFLEGCEDALPSLLRDRETIEASVRIYSTKALNKEVSQLLSRSFVWPGVQVVETAARAGEPWTETTFAQQLLNHQWLPAATGTVNPDITMQSGITHPGGRDVRGPTRLLRVTISAMFKQNRPRMIPVGQDQNSILFMPSCTQTNVFTWDFNNILFRRWQLDGENPLDQLARSALTTGNPMTSLDVQRAKTSGKTRSREENEGDAQKAKARKKTKSP
jgi:hypothetical protein